MLRFFQSVFMLLALGFTVLGSLSLAEPLPSVLVEALQLSEQTLTVADSCTTNLCLDSDCQAGCLASHCPSCGGVVNSLADSYVWPAYADFLPLSPSVRLSFHDRVDRPPIWLT